MPGRWPNFFAGETYSYFMASIDIIIETPKGSREKYNYDPSSKLFKLKKVLPTGLVFPYDFGFVPDTKGEDGDPLDAMVISEFTGFAGGVMTCRIIGAIIAEQSKEEGSEEMMRNDRILAIPEQSEIFEEVNSVKDLNEHLLKELETFFVQYNKLEGRKFEIIRIADAAETMEMIASHHAAEMAV